MKRRRMITYVFEVESIENDIQEMLDELGLKRINSPHDIYQDRSGPSVRFTTVVTRWPKEHSGPIFYRCQFEHEEGELPLTYERMLKAVVYTKFGERYTEVDTLW